MHRTDYNAQCTLQQPNPNPFSSHQLLKLLRCCTAEGILDEVENHVCLVLLFYWTKKCLSSADRPSKFTKMIPNGYLIFEDESFLDSTVAKMNALRKSGQFCDVRLQVCLGIQLQRRTFTHGPLCLFCTTTESFCKT